MNAIKELENAFACQHFHQWSSLSFVSLLPLDCWNCIWLQISISSSFWLANSIIKRYLFLIKKNHWFNKQNKYKLIVYVHVCMCLAIYVTNESIFTRNKYIGLNLFIFLLFLFYASCLARWASKIAKWYFISERKKMKMRRGVYN